MKATYISVWDNGFEIPSLCDINLDTKEVTNVEIVDVESFELHHLEEEFIRLDDGTEIRDFNYDGYEYVDGQREDEEF